MKESIVRMVCKWYESGTNGTKAKERLMNYCNKKEMKYILVFGTFDAKKVPNKKLVLAKNRRELRLNYILCYYGAKMTQKLVQKLEINSFDFSNPKVQISAHNESIMSQNMSHKGESQLMSKLKLKSQSLLKNFCHT